MAHDPQKPDDISQGEWDAADIPELTDEDFSRARPMTEIYAEVVGKNRGGRPKVDRPKVKVGWRLAADVVDAVEGTGKGYTGRVEAILRQAMDEGRL